MEQKGEALRAGGAGRESIPLVPVLRETFLSRTLHPHSRSEEAPQASAYSKPLMSSWDSWIHLDGLSWNLQLQPWRPTWSGSLVVFQTKEPRPRGKMGLVHKEGSISSQNERPSVMMAGPDLTSLGDLLPLGLGALPRWMPISLVHPENPPPLTCTGQFSYLCQNDLL